MLDLPTKYFSTLYMTISPSAQGKSHLLRYVSLIFNNAMRKS